MIPYALLNADLKFEDGTQSNVRVLDLSAAHFTFRLPRQVHPMPVLSGITLHIFEHRLQKEQILSLTDWHCAETDIDEALEEAEQEAAAFYECFRVEVDDPAFAKKMNVLMQDYLQYISLKQAGDDAALSQTLADYPAEKEQIFLEGDFVSQRRAWFEEAVRDIGNDKEQADCWRQVLQLAKENKLQLALSLDNPEKYAAFMEMEAAVFADWFMKKYALAEHPIAGVPVNTVYLGNQYCMHLMPEAEDLIVMIGKAKQAGWKPVLVLPPVKESELEKIGMLLKKIGKNYERNGSGEPIELIVNDWGVPQLVQEMLPHQFQMTLGILLGKRKKDPRLFWKTGAHPEGVFEENALNAGFFRDFLKDTFEIKNYSFESCAYPIRLQEGAALHLPFYQLNTAGHCTLAAFTSFEDRGKQQPICSCEHPCLYTVFEYPQFLQMTGRYNSLFGYDPEILRDGTRLLNDLQNGLHRIVLEVL